MASGYIGKISAVVTANTSDLSKKLRGSIQDWNKFGSSINSSLNKASTDAVKSLEKIFTPVQRLERQLKAALSSPLNIRTEEQANQIRRLTSAAEQINKPLENAASSFNRLSLEVQANFAPALGRAQNQAQTLFRLIEAGRSPSEKAFAAVQSRVEQTTQSIQRLTQAQQIASRGFTGNELQFTNPAAFAALGRNAEATRAAASLSPEAMSFDRTGLIQDQVKSLAKAQSLIQRAAAKVESLRLLPDADSAALANAEKRLSSLVSLSGTYRQFLLNSVEAANEAANAEQLRAKAAEDATKALIEREQTAKRIEQSLAAAEEDRIRKAQQAQDEEIRRLVEREQAAKSVEQSLAASEEARRNKAKQAEDEEIQKLIQREGTAKKVEQSLSDAEEDRRRKAKQSQDDEIKKLIEKERRAKQVEEEISSAEQERAKKKKRTDDEEIQALIKREQAAKRLAAAADQQQAKEAQIVNRRKQIADEFASRSSAEGLALDLDSSELSSAQAKLNVLRQTLSKLSSSEAAAAEAAVSRLGSAVSSAMANGTIRTAETRREIERLTQEAVEASAAAANINPRSLSRSVARAGDVGRRGFDKFSLALNQAAFAIDDFFSSTGGLEFKIRAVQNNLTQLGFVLDGTRGLFLALGAAIAGQAVLALINFINEGRKTEDMVKALSDSLSRQRDIATEVSNVFEEISAGLRQDIFSDAANNADRLSGRLEKLAESFRNVRDEQILQASTEAQTARANVNKVERQIAGESSPSSLILLQRDLLAARNRQAQVEGGVQSAVSLDEFSARFSAIIRDLEILRTRRSINVAGGAGTVPEARIAELSDQRVERILASIDTSSRQAALSAIEQRFQETRSLADQAGALEAFTTLRPGESLPLAASSELQALRQLEVGLSGFDDAVSAITRVVDASDDIAEALAGSRKRIDDFGEGIDSAARFSEAIDSQARVLEKATQDVAKAAGDLIGGRTTPDQFIEALNAATAQVDAEAARRAQLIESIASTFNEEERARLDAANRAQEDAKRQQEADARRAEEDLKASTERGRQLLLGESGRLAEQISASINDIRNAGGGQQGVAAFLADQARQAAPAFFALQDASANAVLQGPSRAALQASDISTQQGTAELNRLLRGDDPAREQNLVELRKQSNALQTLVALAQRDNPGVAN